VSLAFEDREALRRLVTERLAKAKSVLIGSEPKL
jgi:hypothetical protein